MVARGCMPSCAPRASGADERRVARLMREEGLRVKVRRRGRPTTTDSRHPHPVAENVLARRFAVTEIACVNRVWEGDITYVPIRRGAILSSLGNTSNFAVSGTGEVVDNHFGIIFLR